MQHTSNNSPLTPWHIWIDTGGTFTDCLAIPPAERGNTLDFTSWRRAKVLSTSALRGTIVAQLSATQLQVHQNWGACDDLISGCEIHLIDRDSLPIRAARFRAADSIIELAASMSIELRANEAFEVRAAVPAPILAAHLVTGTPVNAVLPPIMMRLATTRGTNALLERRGGRTALFITQGFGDLLEIGDQQRPELFALHIEKPPPLHEAVVEVGERLAADGSVLIPLDLEALRARARETIARGIRVASIALMHSYRNPAHEKDVARVLREVGFEHVSISSELTPRIRILHRAQTASVDAYLSPSIADYLRDVRARLSPGDNSGSRLHVMNSAGGLVDAKEYRACESLLSGPAGGVAGAAAAGRFSGYSRIIGFDMGGTSTDVARYEGDFEYRFEQLIAGVRVMTPTLAIETVAAGGGSICDVVDGRMTVGPQSAGANPGPACYGAGGPLTLTDVNLLLGRLDANQFEIPIALDPAQRAARTAFETIRHSSGGSAVQFDAMLQGFLDIANERMAAAIERISVRQGYDPGDYALVAFGGAGGQHACAIADRLRIATVIMPAEASLLSAFGLGYSAIERFAQRQVLQTLQNCGDSLKHWIAELSASAIDEVEAQGISRDAIRVRRIIVNMRLLGQDATLAIEVDPANAPANSLANWLAEQFAQRYRTIYGHDAPAQSRKPFEVESIQVAASMTSREAGMADLAVLSTFTPGTKLMSRMFAGGAWKDVPVYFRDDLHPGASVAGPALIIDRRSACVIEPDWKATMDGAGALIAVRAAEAKEQASAATIPELVAQELFSNRLTAIADEMGQMLQRTALSTNVKERLDFSCAVLSCDGELVVNAPHIPVHLGAMGVCVRAVRQAIEMEEGDVVITNHPAFGGSHLPDVTVITPVFCEGELIGYVANRAHHAEIGGSRPGSMPPMATTLAEEGVVIAPRHLVKRGESKFDEIEHLLRSGPFPSRAVQDNLADLRAAVAANQRGASAFRELASKLGHANMKDYIDAICIRAESMARSVLASMNGVYAALERLDDGSPIQVELQIENGRMVIDFAGSAAQHAGNLNATPAIVRSAVMYVLRLLIGGAVPLNEGMMRLVDVRVPRGMLNPHFTDDPQSCPAVVGGNTETSQRIVDTLLKALRLSACSQGTMNNVLFGNERFGYYETVCGGSGAIMGFCGADAVHTHMTNTRITDPEILEHRYPVRVNRFAIRRGSGGAGRWRGGDGAVRELTFLENVSLSILSQHRAVSPFGMEGGESGKIGSQTIARRDGTTLRLGSIDGCEVGAGDRLILETPGGGGWGQKPSE